MNPETEAAFKKTLEIMSTLLARIISLEEQVADLRDEVDDIEEDL